MVRQMKWDKLVATRVSPVKIVLFWGVLGTFGVGFIAAWAGSLFPAGFVSVASLSYVVFTVFLFWRSTQRLESGVRKYCNVGLVLYVVLCILSFIAVGYYSPLTFAGSLLYLAGSGVSVSALFVSN